MRMTVGRCFFLKVLGKTAILCIALLINCALLYIYGILKCECLILHPLHVHLDVRTTELYTKKMGLGF